MNSDSNTRPTRPKKEWLPRIIVGVVGVIAVFVAVGMATLWFGIIAGEEFCPETFTRRSFFYYEIPLIGFQISPITRNDTTSAVSVHLTSNNFVPVPKGAKHRWDLVFDTRAAIKASQGDAAILCAYLDATDHEGKHYWEQWTDENKAIAKILWPAVASVARNRLYLFAPQLIDLAEQASDPQQFQSDLDALLAQQYGDLATVHQQLKDHETAVDLLTKALQYAPDDARLLKRRAVSLDALGEKSKAAADVAAAAKAK